MAVHGIWRIQELTPVNLGTGAAMPSDGGVNQSEQPCAKAQDIPPLKKIRFHVQVAEHLIPQPASECDANLGGPDASGVSAKAMLVAPPFVYGEKPKLNFTAEYSG
jgi:hypothetical protein